MAQFIDTNRETNLHTIHNITIQNSQLINAN